MVTNVDYRALTPIIGVTTVTDADYQRPHSHRHRFWGIIHNRAPTPIIGVTTLSLTLIIGH